ncbi:MAG: arsenite efflux transporter metallochaperone ArsD [Bacilli bacterium]
MGQIDIFEPAMCCSTGVCGPSVDTELLRVSSAIQHLAEHGAKVNRYNLTNSPEQFVSHQGVAKLLEQEGVNALPATFVNGVLVKTKGYLTNDEFVNYANGQQKPIQQTPQSGCGCNGNC